MDRWAEWIQNMNAIAGKLAWSGFTVALLFGCGLYFTIKTGFFQFVKFPYILKSTFGTLFCKKNTKETGISPFQALTTALAGTMGVGNIAGVSTAIVSGGPGAIFWMWVSAFLGMMTKYAEVTLSVRYREKKNGFYRGGPMFYMEKGLGAHWLAVLFCALCIPASFGIGNMTQVNSISTALYSSFGLPVHISGIVTALLVGSVVIGGIKRIGRVTEKVIPFISLLYLAGSLAILLHNPAGTVKAFTLILESAFRPSAAAGGAAGYLVGQAMRVGLARGVFTNEAGLGSAPIAHAAADCESPEQQGMWGIMEVFLDTIVVCTMTALVVLSAYDGHLWRQSGLDGAPMTSAAFESLFGRFGGGFLSIFIVFFAVAAMLGWCYYGESALAYLTGDNSLARYTYRLIFVLLAVVGATTELRLVWAVSDTLNGLMIIPNALALLALRKQVRKPQMKYRGTQIPHS